MDKKSEKPAIGLRRLVMWQMISEDDTTVSYGEKKDFVKKLMSASYSPSVSEASLEADDQVVEHISQSDGGDLTIGITSLSSDERALIYGENIVDGTNVENKDDISNYVCVAYMTLRSDKLFNLYKYPKVCFSRQQEDHNTKKKGSTEYATTNTKGSVMPLLKDGNSRLVRYGVDPEKDSQVIEKWFTEAEFYGKTTE